MSRVYRFKSPPYQHQKDAVRFALARFKAGRNVALFMEPRTGKTFTTINVVGALHAIDASTMRKVLIVCPARVIGVWEDEIKKFFPYDCLVTVRDAKGRKKGDIPQTYAPVHFVITNYEAFSTSGKTLPSGYKSKTTGRYKERSRILKWAPDMLVLDESHKIKSASSKAASMIVSMAPHVPRRMILTGTPVTKANRVHDLFMQWKFLNPDQLITGTYDDFKKLTGRWYNEGSGIGIWKGPRQEGIADAKRMIAPDSVIVRREDCFDLPPRETIIRDVKLSAATAKHYDEMAEYMVTQIKEGVIAEAAIPLVVTLRLLQMTSGFVSTADKQIHTIGNEKITALKEYLDELDGQKVVIAARFQNDLDQIMDLTRSLGIPTWAVRGGMKRKETDDAIKAFRRSDEGAMVIQPQAAALGIDLSTAHHMIWYSLTYSFVDFSQANDRIALSKKATTYCYLLAPDTIDELVYNVLQSDGEVARAIMEDPERILRK